MLIDKQGKIELQNAPSPIDNFQEKFAQILIAKRKEELELKRKQRLYQTW